MNSLENGVLSLAVGCKGPIKLLDPLIGLVLGDRSLPGPHEHRRMFSKTSPGQRAGAENICGELTIRENLSRTSPCPWQGSGTR